MSLTRTRRPFPSPGESLVPRSLVAGGVRAAGATTALILLAGCGASMNMEDAAMEGMDMEASSSAMADDGHSHMHGSEGDGTEASLDGFAMENLESTATSEYGGKVTFRIMQDNGVPLTTYEPVQTKPMHMYLVSEDLKTYHHLHPTKNMGGDWSAEVPALPAGRLRVVADFVGIGDDRSMNPLILGTDLTIDGTPESATLPEPAPTVKVDGYVAELGDGLVAGQEAKLSFKVTEKGKPAELVPYLASWSHTSVFAADSLAFSHIHPAQEWTEGSENPEELTFVWTPETSGTYRFFIQFETATGLHLAEFTRTVG